MQRAAIIVKDPQQQLEGLRTSVGLLTAGMVVQVFVLHHEIQNIDKAFRDELAALDSIGGMRYSDNMENTRKYGFKHVTIDRAADQIRQADIIIPF